MPIFGFIIVCLAAIGAVATTSEPGKAPPAGSEPAAATAPAPTPAAPAPAAPVAAPPTPAAPTPTVQAPAPAKPEPAKAEPVKAEPAKVEPTKAPAPQEAAAPAAKEPTKAKTAEPLPTCQPEVNLKAGFVTDRHDDGKGNCLSTGKKRPLRAIECTDGSPAGYYHRYYLDQKHNLVFVTGCLPPEGK